MLLYFQATVHHLLYFIIDEVAKVKFGIFSQISKFQFIIDYEFCS